MFQKLASSEGVRLQGLDDLTWNDPNIFQPYHKDEDVAGYLAINCFSFIWCQITTKLGMTVL